MCTVGDVSDRRARKKARTRCEILRAAQQLFAERGFDAVTIADVAADADVAVQTVFNHFSSKEELFFADRTPWVDGPAEAVRRRPAGALPLDALRDYTLATVDAFVRHIDSPQRRELVDVILAAPALRAFERELEHRTEQRLAAALAEAWAVQGPDGAGCDLDVRLAATLTAALWISAARALSVELRSVYDEGADVGRIKVAVESLTDRTFTRLANSLGTLLQLPAQGPFEQPGAQPARRAGYRRAG
jgi:AcrR family transcriptional regulator